LLGSATWDFQNTLWDNTAVVADDEELGVTLLATADSESASVESEEGTDYTTAAIVSASALTLSIFACAYI